MRTHRLVLGLLLCLLPGRLPAQTIKAKVDQFGNPVGEGYSLAADGEFRGKTLLAWSAYHEVPTSIFPETNPLWRALRAKGFEIRIQSGAFDPAWLQDADQLWLFSGFTSGMDERAYDAVVDFVDRGKGLYLLADNQPAVAESNALAQRLFGAQVRGNYRGDQIIAVRGRGVTRDDLLKSQQTSAARPSPGTPGGSAAQPPVNLPPGAAQISIANKATHYVEDHALLTDIHFLYEGITISHIVPTADLHVVLSASDGKVLAAVARDRKKRVVVDCGYTRYFVQFVTKTAGTIRYAENIAAYLMGKDSKTETDVSKLRGNVSGLLAGLHAAPDSKRQRAIAAELAKTSPKYGEIEDQLEKIWEFSASENEEVAAAAKDQIVNAFQRAQISHCLYWVGRGDEQLAALIWRQIDSRIDRADSKRRAEYGNTALKVLAHDGFNTASRKAAMQLLARLKDPQVAGQVTEMLLDLPRELWPDAGRLLGDLTGQDFGPRLGDGIGDALKAKKQWQAWLQANPHR